MTKLATIDLDTLSTVHGGSPTPRAQPQPPAHNNDASTDVDMSIGGQGGRGGMQIGAQARLHVTSREPAYLRCVNNGLPLVDRGRMSPEALQRLCAPLANR